jgi:hypothetical protein
VPLDHSPPPFPSIAPDAKQVGRWEWFTGKVGFEAGKGREGQERGDGAVAVAANAVSLLTRHVEDSKARQTAAEQIVEQGSEVESRDVVHETTSVGKSTLVGSSALLSPVSTNRPPQVMGQAASANVLPLPGACAPGIQGHATAHVGTAAGVAGGLATTDATASSQDATGDKSIDLCSCHAVKAHGSKREEYPSDAGNEEEDPTLKEEASQLSTSRDHEAIEFMSSPFASCSIGFSLLGGGEQPDDSGFAEHMGLSALELENRFMEEGITRLKARGAEGAFVVTAETGFLETSLVSTWVWL